MVVGFYYRAGAGVKHVKEEYLNTNSKIYITGHRGLLGTAVLRMLCRHGYRNLVVRTREEIDLRRQKDVEDLFRQEKPEYVFLIAAKVGGIGANMGAPADFIYDNMLIAANIIHASFKYGSRKVLFVSSSCSYPRECSQPMKEEYLLCGRPEPTNEYYAVAKIAGMKMAEAYYRQYGFSVFSLIFPNIYGPGDTFDLEKSHVIPALIRKIYEARLKGREKVTVWGTGRARREFLYVDDAAAACIFFIDRLKGGEMVNAGYGEDISVRELAVLIKEVVGYEGKLVFDSSKPDGMPRKLLDVSCAAGYGWSPQVSLRKGLKKTFEWYKNREK